MAGAERFSQANSLDQDIYELTDNLTFGLGDNRITIGTHNEFFHFNNVFFPQSIGQWTFANAGPIDGITNFENNTPTRLRSGPAAPVPVHRDRPTARRTPTSTSTSSASTSRTSSPWARTST